MKAKHMNKSEKTLNEKVLDLQSKLSEADFAMENLRSENNALKKKALRDGYTEIPVEELGDCLEDVKSSIRQIRAILADEISGYAKTQSVMDVLQKLTRIEAFCTGRSNALNPYSEDSVANQPENY